MSCSRRCSALALLATALAAPPARAWVLPVAEPAATLRIHAARVVVVAGPDRGAPDTWTVAFEVSGHGTGGLFLPLLEPDVAQVVPELHPTLDALEEATAPRLMARPPWDPCAFGVGRFARAVPFGDGRRWGLGPEAWRAAWPSIRTPSLTPARATWATRAFSGPESAEEWLDAAGLGTLRGAVGSPPAGGLLRLRPNPRPRWTPPIQVRRPRAARQELGLDALAATTPPGRLLEIDVHLLAPGTGLRLGERASDLPTEIALPEIAFEHPIDTERAILRQKRVLEGQGAIVRRFRGPPPPALARALGAPSATVLARFALVRGPRGRDPVAILAAPPGRSELAPLWLVHRPWRGPIDCAEGAAYLRAVATHQALTLRTLATASGRPMAVLVAAMRDRGYLVEPFEAALTADPSTLELRPVEVDRSAWAPPPS